MPMDCYGSSRPTQHNTTQQVFDRPNHGADASHEETLDDGDVTGEREGSSAVHWLKMAALLSFRFGISSSHDFSLTTICLRPPDDDLSL